MVYKNAMFGVEAGNSERSRGEAALRDRLSPRHQGLAVFVVAMALCGAASAAPLHAKKGRAHRPPIQQSAPSLMHYIHCAMEVDQGLCGPDPAMLRLNGEPPISARPAQPFDQPEFAPRR
jgi:hypothetical protein